MSLGLMAVVTALYTGVVISEIYRGNGGNAIVFMGYAFANLGLMWNMR